MATTAYDYPGTTASASNDNLSSYVMYQMPIKSHEERDEDERKTLFPQIEFDTTSDSYPSADYIECYWHHFHPVYPVVHRATFGQEEPSPLLKAAMMAVGAQYSKQSNARADGRNFHERCLKLLSQRDLDVGLLQRPCDMQAIFLIELVSQYRGRRASQQLSNRFRHMYSILATDSEVMSSGNTLGSYAKLSPALDQRNKWKQWVRLSTRQRLLIACYILESQQDSLLARKLPKLTVSGLELPLPSRLSVWDADSASSWLCSLQQHPASPNFVYAIPTDPNTPQSFQAADAFQSALLISAHLNRLKTTSRDTTALPQTIDPSIPTQLLYLACHLSRDIPLRDLLAVAGETWILSEKVSSEEVFTAHKNAVRSWIAPLWTHSKHPPPIHIAMKHAVRLLRLSLSTQPTPTLIPGTEMGLYTAVLVLWAVTTAATARWKQCVRAATPTPQILSSSDAGAEMDERELERETSEFISLFDFDVALKGIEGVGRWPQGGVPLALTQWQRGVGAVLRRVQGRIGGRSGGRDGGSSGGPGELLEGASGVLSKLGRNGWGVELF
ncbi:hypothetical protein EJ05DRAFT_505166 [Pseudovirgaria hyperparasitica]|uniref:Xylanolytic transcriptional activator regulatory domain-containing protein n=1 Tax=Pseudovirgaria hyperparasitica TaxID=470096 RepID=A0A6A6VUY6_9PEZI|nr:uncharacterized protein EJ05DRAFT_505166 [Pseudovirgaria hyperparasitica]KAF2753534.1 hypothetical protein EJ05DRAFT_505166 [Pseudovirgaria hyperparasitica]